MNPLAFELPAALTNATVLEIAPLKIPLSEIDLRIHRCSSGLVEAMKESHAFLPSEQILFQIYLSAFFYTIIYPIYHSASKNI